MEETSRCGQRFLAKGLYVNFSAVFFFFFLLRGWGRGFLIGIFLKSFYNDTGITFKMQK